MKDGESSKINFSETDKNKSTKATNDDKYLRKLRRMHLDFSDQPTMSTNHFVNKPEWMRAIMRFDKTPRSQRINEIRGQIETYYDELNGKIDDTSPLRAEFDVNIQRAKTLSDRVQKLEGHDPDANSMARDYTLESFRTIANNLQKISNDLKSDKNTSSDNITESNPNSPLDVVNLSQLDKVQHMPLDAQQIEVDTVDKQMDECVVRIAHKLIRLVNSSDFDMKKFQELVGSTPGEVLKRVQTYRADPLAHRDYMQAMNFNGKQPQAIRDKASDSLHTRKEWLLGQERDLEGYEKYPDIEQLKQKHKDLEKDVQSLPISLLEFFRPYVKSGQDRLNDPHQAIPFTKLREFEEQKKLLEQQIRNMEQLNGYIKNYQQIAAPYIVDVARLANKLQNSSSYSETSFHEYIQNFTDKDNFTLADLLALRPKPEPPGQVFGGLTANCRDWHDGCVALVEDYLTYADAPRILEERLKEIQASPNYDEINFKQFMGKFMGEISKSVDESINIRCFEGIQYLEFYQINDHSDILQKRIKNLQAESLHATTFLNATTFADDFEKVMESKPDLLIRSLQDLSSMAKGAIENKDYTRKKALNNLEEARRCLDQYRRQLNCHFPEIHELEENDIEYTLISDFIDTDYNNGTNIKEKDKSSLNNNRSEFPNYEEIDIVSEQKSSQELPKRHNLDNIEELTSSKSADKFLRFRREIRNIFRPKREGLYEKHLGKDKARPSKEDRLDQIDKGFLLAKNYLDENMPHIPDNFFQGLGKSYEHIKIYQESVARAKQCRIDAQWGDPDIRAKSESDYKQLTQTLIELARLVQQYMARSEQERLE